MTFKDIDVSDLIGHPGMSRPLRVAGSVEDLSTEVAEVAGEVTAALLLESIIEGIWVSGTLSGVFALRCARCLDGFERAFSFEVHELFSERPEPDGEDYALEPNETLQPGQMAVDAIGMEMPFAPLCRPDCLGLCETCGRNRNLGGCSGHPQHDPRWAGLEAVLESMSE